MNLDEIDKTKEYTFIEAWGMSIENNNVIIKSKRSGDRYKVEKFSNKYILKFFNPTIAAWQKCTYVLPEELFDKWYMTTE